VDNQKLPTFDLLDDYNKETERQRERIEQMAAAVKEAETRSQALKLRKDNALQAAVLNNEDNTAEITKVDKQLEKAESELTLAKQKEQVARNIADRTITLQDVERAFYEFGRVYQEEVVEDKLGAIRAAKEEYVKAYLDYVNVKEQYEKMAREVTHLVHPKAFTTLYGLKGFGTVSRREYVTISDYDNEQLQRGATPRSMSRGEG
jgi:Fe2+ transport system protein B